MLGTTHISGKLKDNIKYRNVCVLKFWCSAEIFAADMFQTVFARDPLSKDAWQSFRQGILTYGGSRDELGIVEQFLGGRKTTPEALLAMLGVLSGSS